jgi:hypothetical protein
MIKSKTPLSFSVPSETLRIGGLNSLGLYWRVIHNDIIDMYAGRERSSTEKRVISEFQLIRRAKGLSSWRNR